MINPLVYNKIISKFTRLDEYYNILKEIKKTGENSFVSDYHFYGLAERYLQLSIEIVLDTGKMILNAENLPRAEDNQGVFDILKENKIISKKLHEQSLGIANFRNILVHDYEKIDRTRVYENLQDRIDFFMQFKKEIAQYLKGGI